jgi:DNA-binding response OmpR family regulator
MHHFCADKLFSLAHPLLSLLCTQRTMKSPKKILLVDQEPGITRLVRQALERAGKYLVQEEHDDRAALQTARGFQPDLILLDTAATSPEGQVLERQLHSDAVLKDTPVVRLSSLKSESEMVSGGILSGYSFFAGPVRLEEVLRGVENILFGKD